MQNDSIDNLRLDLNKKSVRGVIYVRSGDTRARTIHITLTNNGTVVDLADAVICELLILKPDGGMNDQTMVRYGNELQYTFRTADINVPGECKCQVQVTFNDHTTFTSSEFSVMVYQKEVDQELERSTNEYTAIAEILVEVQDLKNQADQDADRAETARTSIEGSEEACRQYAESAALDATSASESATSAESSAENAETSASNAQSYAESAETNMTETRENLAAVEEKAEEILGYDSSAQESAEDAAASATAASASETSASNYANASQTSAGNSANSALDSEAWAKGTRSGSDIPATDPAYNKHSKYWAEKAQEAATSFPTHLSSFVNDMGFIDNTVNDLVNYYTQSQTYTQAEINALIAAINQMHIEIVSSLPTEDIDTHTIYFLPKEDPETGDYYEEYIYVNNAWERIGTTQITSLGHTIVNPSGTDMTQRAKMQFTGNVTVTDDSTNDKTIVNITDSGHIIENPAGTDLTQRANLQFKDAHLSDDSVNDRTIVETFKAVTEAEYSSETEDGAYIITDGDGAVIEPASEDYVEVTADGEKTLATLLNNLFSLSDNTKISKSSIVVFHYTSGNSIVFLMDAITPTNYIFSRSRAGSGGAEVETLIIRSTDSTDKSTTISTNGTVTVTDNSNDVFSNGAIITLYYGQKKAVVDLQTTASRCLMADGTTVQQALTTSVIDSVMINLGALNNGDSGYKTGACPSHTGYTPVAVWAQASKLGYVGGNIMTNCSLDGNSYYMNYKAFGSISADNSDVYVYFYYAKSQ